MDYIYIFRCNVVNDHNIIHCEYVSCTMKAEFKDKLNGAAQGFGVLVIDCIEDN
ncbi:uncharacterized protein ACA1_156350 [Acanthamoeba castellanii str. Neff]|uniref:Uncharacterized protein n=1 Tax=Acanthamoeba castellanii (strain ATCC 30010 / Neff) TaxID=1257118 RepID=L8GIF2_ACACF|nr:uncharacterized protein ACA1_156350 [Acanthamoeba castellanii str. Neff]ELR12533.1 hypothetical protein ACA1_156350 [Acanthamoeba castellanii str. Neff]